MAVYAIIDVTRDGIPVDRTVGPMSLDGTETYYYINYTGDTSGFIRYNFGPSEVALFCNQWEEYAEPEMFYGEPNQVEFTNANGTVRITGYTPEKPVNPSPSNAASNVTLGQALISWEDGGGATSYDVHYGDTSGDLTLVSEGQAGLTFTIWDITLGSPFDYLITRYWRVDAVNEFGTRTGDEWSFRTIPFDEPQTSYRFISGGNGSGPYDGSSYNNNPLGTQGIDWEWTGENAMLTVRRLVAAANSKIFYEDI